MSRLIERVAPLALVGIVAAACSDDTPTDTDPPVEATEIAVDDNFFEPQNAAVSTDDDVTWEWRGAQPHNVTWDDTDDLQASETMEDGSHEVTAPSEPGEYGYHCTVHGSPGSGMHGTLVVE